MTAEEFVNNCYKEKQEMLKIYFDKEKETQVGNQIKNIVSKGISNDEVKELVDSVMNEVGVRIDIWTHLMRGCIIELCTPI